MGGFNFDKSISILDQLLRRRDGYISIRQNGCRPSINEGRVVKLKVGIGRVPLGEHRYFMISDSHHHQ